MDTKLLKGAPVAAAIEKGTAERVQRLKARGVLPTLAVLRLGEDSGAVSYEKGIEKRCVSCGVALQRHILPQSATQAELEAAVRALNDDVAVHGIILMRPLSRGFDEEAVCRLIAPGKDVDCASPLSLGAALLGEEGAFSPCTAEAAVKMLDFYLGGDYLEGKRAVVLGRSRVVGLPLSMLLLRKNAAVTVCHSRSGGNAAICRAADVIISATGRLESVGRDFFAPGQVLIDVGIGWSDVKQKLVGDVKADEALGAVTALSPVPGGVGAVTNAVLIEHTVLAAERLSTI